MIIQHYKQTNLSRAPDELSRCINKYSEHKSSVQKNHLELDGCDLVHYHNKVWKHRVNPWGTPSILQLHSEPPLTDYLHHPGITLVVAQYQATLLEYSHGYPIRNIIDFADNPAYEFNEVPAIHIVYSPSTIRKRLKWIDKGFAVTVDILKRLKEEHPEITVDVVTGTSLDECIRRKSNASIVIDECVTGSYHRSALEGLALGKVTIAGMDGDVETVFKQVSGSDYVPIRNIAIGDLYGELKNTIENESRIGLVEEGWRNREWMFSHWHPQAIVDEYIKVYKRALVQQYWLGRIGNGNRSVGEGDE